MLNDELREGKHLAFPLGWTKENKRIERGPYYVSEESERL